MTISGRNQEEHDVNLKKFMEAAKESDLTLNEDKSTFSTTKLCLLGSVIEHGEVRPDPERLRPLREMPAPHDSKSLKRAQGFFSYYSAWISNFSEKLKPLIQATKFPLPEEAVTAFENLKKEVEDAVVVAIDEDLPFTLETDASDTTIAAILNQSNRPVAFFSRTLHGHEVNSAAVEKEALAIVESVRYWRHFLTGRHFTIKTDQKSISYVFDSKHRNKIKNDKIARWKLELSVYSFDIQHKPGSENIPPDTLSRVHCSAAASTNQLYQLHDSLCHPGVTRLSHYVRSKNLPYSIEDVRTVTKNCMVCAEEKPRYHKPEKAHLIKSTIPFERINVDFKGPLPSTNQNQYFLQVIDEYSRFPFVFPCKDMKSETVKQCFSQLFSLYGYPGFVHSDRGSSFLSKELQDFLLERGIASSHTTPYRPAANGQVERYNSTTWRAIRLILRSKNLSISHWQEVLPEALHSVRSLLCTATNQTPHERFLSFTRRSATGTSVPSWLMNPGNVLLRKYVRNSKNDPFVEEVELIKSNPQYAHIRYPDGRESTVSVQDLAPRGTKPPELSTPTPESAPAQEPAPTQVLPAEAEQQSQPPPVTAEALAPSTSTSEESAQSDTPPEEIVAPPRSSEPSAPELRRSSRPRRENSKYKDYVCSTRLCTLV